jgi:Ca2+-binding RTX toxin-like protein
VAIVAVLVLVAVPPSAFGATLSINESGSVVYKAAPGELNDVQVSISAGIITISDTGAVIVAGLGCNQVSDHEATCSGAGADLRLGDLNDVASSVASQAPLGGNWFGQGGDDRLTKCSQCGGLLIGGSGADTLQGGDVGATLRGGEGSDSLTGGAGDDVIIAGRGRDKIDARAGDDGIVPGLGADSADGGPGRDRLIFRDWPTGVVVDLRLGTATGQGAKTLVGIEVVFGTRLRDELYGNGARNDLFGNSGGDLLVGRGRADYLSGDWGNDRLFGGRGDDQFEARDGFRDVLSGGRGADIARVDRRLDLTNSIKVVPFLLVPTALVDNGPPVA